MTYTDTVRRYMNASYGFSAPKSRQDSADKLPMSEWAEARRAEMSPATIAHNHAIHVSDCAEAVRSALRDVTEDTTSSGYEIADRLAYATRALLAAIGEGEL